METIYLSYIEQVYFDYREHDCVWLLYWCTFTLKTISRYIMLLIFHIHMLFITVLLLAISLSERSLCDVQSIFWPLEKQNKCFQSPVQQTLLVI